MEWVDIWEAIVLRQLSSCPWASVSIALPAIHTSGINSWYNLCFWYTDLRFMLCASQVRGTEMGLVDTSHPKLSFRFPFQAEGGLGWVISVMNVVVTLGRCPQLPCWRATKWVTLLISHGTGMALACGCAKLMAMNEAVQWTLTPRRGLGFCFGGSYRPSSLQKNCLWPSRNWW